MNAMPLIDEFDCLVNGINRDDGEDRCEDFPAGVNATRCKIGRHSLGHQAIVTLDVCHNRGGNELSLLVSLSTQYYFSLRPVQKSLDPPEVTRRNNPRD